MSYTLAGGQAACLTAWPGSLTWLRMLFPPSRHPECKQYTVYWVNGTQERRKLSYLDENRSF